MAKLADKEKVLVFLASFGGGVSAIRIGETIRLTGMRTVVAPGIHCESICAFIWLAGSARFMEPGAVIGFHGAYDANTQQEMAMADARIGVYLGYLHISYDAAEWMLEAKPLAMHYLTPETSEKYGIDYSVLNLPPRLWQRSRHRRRRHRRRQVSYC